MGTHSDRPAEGHRLPGTGDQAKAMNATAATVGAELVLRGGGPSTAFVVTADQRFDLVRPA